MLLALLALARLVVFGVYVVIFVLNSFGYQYWCAVVGVVVDDDGGAVGGGCVVVGGGAVRVAVGDGGRVANTIVGAVGVGGGWPVFVVAV